MLLNTTPRTKLFVVYKASNTTLSVAVLKLLELDVFLHIECCCVKEFVN